MAVVPTPRAGLKTFTAGTDPHPSRTEHNTERDLLDAIMALADQGTTAARPAAGIARRFYWDADVERLYFDNGTAWKEVTTNGAGGPGSAVVPGAAAVEGTSARSARADHTHSLALATASAHGAMSSTDKTKLDNAVSAATASRLVVRDAAGRAAFADPTVAADAATKGYVDGQVATRAATAHTHAAADVVSGVLDAARLPAATQTVQGALAPADKAKLDNAVSAATASRLVVRDAAGRAAFADPTVAADAATKGYVDTGLGTKAPTSHNHDWSHLTTGVPATFPPSGHTHAATDVTTGILDPARLPAATVAAQGALSAADKAKLDNAVSAATASRLVMRDAAGRAAFADPAVAADAATKGYVDTGDAARAPLSHTHAAGDIASGTFSPDRLPTVTQTAQGAMSAADKTKLDNASVNAVASTLVLRGTDGRITTQRPTAAAHAADKDYVDDVGLARVTWSEFDKRITRGGNYTYLRSPNGGAVFAVNDSGTMGSGAIYNTDATATGTAWRALWVNNSGVLGYNLSSRKYKTNERDYQVPLAVLDGVSPKWFQYRKDVAEMGAENAPWRVNFVAEDLHDAGLREYVSYNDEAGSREEAETINEQLMVNALWSFTKQLRQQVAGLQEQVRALGGR